MSFARFGAAGSDVYVFLDAAGFLDCCACSLCGNFKCDTVKEMQKHLQEHKAQGDCVPNSCIHGLFKERKRIDSYIKDCKENGYEI